MTFGARVKGIRKELGVSQEAVGAQGFVSTPGWIKIENGQRQASEKLIDNMLKWLVGEKYIKGNLSAGLREELLTLKYLESNSLFVREMAKAHASKSTNPGILAALEATNGSKPKDKPGATLKTSVKAKPAAGKKKKG